MKLFDYYRSTTSYRVRIILNLKNISYERIPVHLTRDGGEQHLPAYRDINPQGLVPTLELHEQDDKRITQSMAIMEYLEEKHPNPPLLPFGALARSHVRSLSNIIACDMHPLNNLRVMNQLRTEFNADDDMVSRWYHHWLKLGFDAFEARLTQLNSEQPVFCYGDALSFADICLIPQVYNAERFGFSLEAYPYIQAINQHCKTLEAFEKAAPEACEALE
jgi:maleylacetoacetate isomerase